MENTHYSSRRKHNSEDNNYRTELSRNNGDEFRSAYVRKRTIPPPHSHGSRFSTRSGNKTPDLSSEFEHICHICHRPNSRVDIAPVENTYYDYDYEDELTINKIFVPKNSIQNIEVHQTNKKNQKSLKKKVRFQLTPSKSTPNTRKHSVDSEFPVPPLWQYGSKSKSNARPTRHFDDTPVEYERHVLSPDKTNFDIYEDSLPLLQGEFRSRNDISPSQGRNIRTCSTATGDGSGHPTSYYSSESDATSDSDTDKLEQQPVRNRLLRPRKPTTSDCLPNSDSGKSTAQTVNYKKIPSRLPRPVTDTSDHGNILHGANNRFHNVSSHANSNFRQSQSAHNYVNEFVEFRTDSRLSRSSASEHRNLNVKRIVERNLPQLSTSKPSDNRFIRPTETVPSADSSDDEEEHFVPNIPRRNVLSSRYKREDIKPNGHTPREFSKMEQHVHQTFSDESEEELIEANKHSIKTEPFQSHAHLRRKMRSSNSARTRIMENEESVSSRMDKAHCKPKMRDYATETSIGAHNYENSFSSDRTQSRPIMRAYEPMFEPPGNKTLLLKSERSVRRKHRKPLEEANEEEDAEQHVEPRQQDKVKNYHHSEYETLCLTNHDIQMLKQAEESHRMFMAVWLPSRASSRTFSKPKRSILDTPPHLLMLRRTDEQDD